MSFFKWNSKQLLFTVASIMMLVSQVVVGNAANPAVVAVKFQGIVISQIDEAPLNGIIVEITPKSGAVIDAGITTEEGLFYAQLLANREYSVSFFKPLPVGKALVSKQSFNFEAGNPNHTFKLPIAGRKRVGKPVDFQGDIFKEGKPVSGIMSIVDAQSGKTKDRIRILRGHFNITISAQEEDQFHINLQGKDGREYKQIYTLSASNWMLTNHEIDIQLSEEEITAAATPKKEEETPQEGFREGWSMAKNREAEKEVATEEAEVPEKKTEATRSTVAEPSPQPQNDSGWGDTPERPDAFAPMETEAPANKPQPQPMALEPQQLVVQFKAYSDTVATASLEQLSQIAKRLLAANTAISVRGFAESYNLPIYDLTQRRVFTIVDYLTEQGVPKEAIHYSYALPSTDDDRFQGVLIRVKQD